MNARPMHIGNRRGPPALAVPPRSAVCDIDGPTKLDGASSSAAHIVLPARTRRQQAPRKGQPNGATGATPQGRNPWNEVGAPLLSPVPHRRGGVYAASEKPPAMCVPFGVHAGTDFIVGLNQNAVRHTMLSGGTETGNVTSITVFEVLPSNFQSSMSSGAVAPT